MSFQNKDNSKIHLPDGSPIYDSGNAPSILNPFKKYILMPFILISCTFLTMLVLTLIAHSFGYCITGPSGHCDKATDNTLINAITITIVPAIIIVIRSLFS